MNMSEASSSNVEQNVEIISIDQLKTIEVEPTAEELATLEHIADRIPLIGWLIIICGVCEGFASMGTYQIMQNYIQFPVTGPNSTQPGALDRGQQIATALTLSYSVFCYLTPVGAGIIADNFWGKYKTLVVASFIYLVGLILLVLTSLPMSIKGGVALPGLICSMLILGVGIGGFETASGPFMAEQYTRKNPVIIVIKGTKKIIDPEITVQSLFNWLCCAYALGTLTSTIITTSVERYHSFWLAFLIPLCIFPISIIILLINHRRFIQIPPTSSLVLRGFRIAALAIKNRWKLGKQPSNKHWLDYAKENISTNESETGIIQQSQNQFIDDLKETFHACRVFAFFPFYWLCYNQISGNLTSQAAQMNVGPVPNDVLGSISPLFVVVFAPICDKILYPLLRQYNIKFSPMKRITCGFFIAALGMTYISIVQYLIYSTGPNYNYKTKPCSTCQTFNNINVAWQLPSYFFLAISEIFAYISGLEYAFMNAPTTMKSLVMSLFLFTAAIGGLFNIALIPVNVDPKLLWMYTSIAIATFIIAIISYIVFRKDQKQTLLEHKSTRRLSILNIKGYS